MQINSPISPEFWEEYRQFMRSTFDNTQSLLNQMTQYMGPASIQDSNGWVNTEANFNNPEVRINDEHVIVTFKHNQGVNKENIKIYLDGYQLILQGDIEAKVALPTAVQKYGGRAVAKDNILEVTLKRDKFNQKQKIAISGD